MNILFGILYIILYMLMGAIFAGLVIKINRKYKLFPDYWDHDHFRQNLYNEDSIFDSSDAFFTFSIIMWPALLIIWSFVLIIRFAGKGIYLIFRYIINDEYKY